MLASAGFIAWLSSVLLALQKKEEEEENFKVLALINLTAHP